MELWIWVVFLLVVAVFGVATTAMFARWAIARRQRGPARIGVPMAYFLMAVFPLMAGMLLIDELSRPGRNVLLIIFYSVFLGAMLLVIWRAYLQRRRDYSDDARLPFTWESYAVVAGALVVLHAVMVFLYLQFSASVAAGPEPPHGWQWLGRAVVTVFVFLFSQLTSAAAVRTLAVCFKNDWVVKDTKPVPRKRQYGLTALPLMLCLIPSVVLGPLLIGVVWRLLILWVGWKYTVLFPASQLKTLREFVQTITGRRRAVADDEDATRF